MDVYNDVIRYGNHVSIPFNIPTSKCERLLIVPGDLTNQDSFAFSGRSECFEIVKKAVASNADIRDADKPSAIAYAKDRTNELPSDLFLAPALLV